MTIFGANKYTLIFVMLVLFVSANNTMAGAYIFSGTTNGLDVITHPSSFTGAGGVVTVGVCINPASEVTTQMETAVQNIVNTFNALQATTGNLRTNGNNNVPAGSYDFESVALHELGHCLGLAHPNASSESGLGGADMNYTKATTGANNVFDINPGPDGVIGSRDDVRGDDVNLHWFSMSTNNPFILDSIVDSTTYARDTANLPAGDSYAANADRQVSSLLGVPGSEAAMQQGTGSDEAQRTLVADDVATLRYAMSGLDEIQGTNDDYTLNLVYRGITSTNCDVSLRMTSNITPFAFCQVTGAPLGNGHFRLETSNASFNGNFNWFFNDVSNSTDTTPDVFVFNDQTGVAINTTVTSNAITVTGITAAAGISVTGGNYSVNNGTFTTTPGTVNAGDVVRVRHVSSSLALSSTNTILTIGGVSDTFTSTTIGADTTPNAFSFTDQANVAISALITSNTITVSGINAATQISVAGGSYSINNAVFTTATGTVNNGDNIRVRHTSATTPATSTNTTLTIGGVSDIFTSTTIAADTTPNPFSFIDQTNVALNTTVVSNQITVSGINAGASVSVSGGDYSVNGGFFTSNPSLVNNGDTVRVRHVTSSVLGTTVNTMLTIGGVSDVFSTTTGAVDITPGPFSFIDQSGVPLNTSITSNSISVTSINSPAPVSVSGGEYRINNGAYVTTAGQVNNGDSVSVRHVSSGASQTTTNTVLTIGGISDTFSSTTLAVDTVPVQFTFVDRSDVALNTNITSNTIVVSGINASVAISVSGGSYNINGGVFTTLPGTVVNGDVVSVRHTSSSALLDQVNTTLSIGPVSDTFTSTTLSGDTTPDAFSFIDQLNVATNATVVSNTVTVTGINSAVPISIVGGQYRINGGPQTTISGTVNNGDRVSVSHVSSALLATTTDTVLTIGGVSDIFSSTTVGADNTPGQFTFVDQTNVDVNTLITSNMITVSGINNAVSIEVVSGEYSVNAGSFTSAAGTVSNGDTVQVRHTSSQLFATSVTTVLVVGGVSDAFTSTTIDADTTPDTFTFNDPVDVNTNTLLTSSTITVSGISAAAVISVINGEYSINGGAFTSAAGVVQNSDTVQLRHTTSSQSASTTTTTLTIGGVSDSFTSTTRGNDDDDDEPDPFEFDDLDEVVPGTIVVSNPVIISGVTGAVGVSISGGEYSVNGSAFTTSSTMVLSGDTIVVRHVTSSDLSAMVSTTLQVGTRSDVFTSKTYTRDIIPDSFKFSDLLDVEMEVEVVSTPVTITGINVDTPVSVINGEYSINGKAFTSSIGTVSKGDRISVKHLSSDKPSSETRTIVTVGGHTDTFSSTTASTRSGSEDGGGGATGMMLWLLLGGVYARRRYFAGKMSNQSE